MSELTLSEAIRLGSMLTRKGLGPRAQPGRSCALRAASEAVGIAQDSGYLDYQPMRERWPILMEVVAHPTGWQGHPIRGPYALLDVIWNLNDSCRWTREQIADFVARVESEKQQADASARAGDAVAGDSLVTSGSPVRV